MDQLTAQEIQDHLEKIAKMTQQEMPKHTSPNVRSKEAARRLARACRKQFGELMWFEEYPCGCVSRYRRRERDLLGYCSRHGGTRRFVMRVKVTPEELAKDEHRIQY